jgi:hypothetical protein
VRIACVSESAAAFEIAADSMLGMLATAVGDVERGRAAGAVYEQVEAAVDRLGGGSGLSLVGDVELERGDPHVIRGDSRPVTRGRVDALGAGGEELGDETAADSPAGARD